MTKQEKQVLNLIINGLPSILVLLQQAQRGLSSCFKPYYKWITFNTYEIFNLVFL